MKIKDLLLNRNSLIFKNALIYFLIIAFTALITAFLIYWFSAEKIKASSKVQMQHTNQLVASTFNSFIANVERDIDFLSNNPIIESFIQASGTKKQDFKTQLSKEFFALLESKPEYAQIRFIANDSIGKEIIRVDKIGTVVQHVSEDKLQAKGDRDYFKEIKNLNEGSKYFSVIDLNKERGGLSYPLTPTFRAAAPLFTNKKFCGFVIINVDIRNFLKELKLSIPEDYSFYLFNNEQQFLQHPIDTLSFGFEFNRKTNFNQFVQFHNPVFNQIQDVDQNKTQIINQLHYPRDYYYLYTCIVSERNLYLASFTDWKITILWVTFSTILFSLLIALWLTYKWVRELRQITDSLIHFSKDMNKIPEVEIKRNDEIGELSRSFNDMAIQIHQHVKELNEAKNIAEKANKEKAEFLENMSHEMRNPLQSILGVSQLIAKNNPRTDQKNFIETLEYSANSLLSLVNDVLDFKKLQLGSIKLTRKQEKLRPELEKLIRSHYLDASLKKIHLELVTSISEEQLFQLDLLRLSQVIHNLISNAIKFSHEKSQVILEVNYSEGYLHFVVTDQGVGISQSQIDLIKERYFSFSKNETIAGSGIGLHIVSGILELFDTQLKIESELGIGSRFSFKIKSEITENSFNNNKVNLFQILKKIAILDDDTQIVFWLKHIFSEINVDLYTFHNAAIFNSSHEVFDIIISDKYLNSEISPQFQGKITSEGLLLVLSGEKSSTAEVSAFFNYKVDAILLKPITSKDLLSTIEKLYFEKNCGIINTKNLYQDYDFDFNKIENVLSLLCQEWQTLHDKTIHSLHHRNQEEFNQVYHKIITSLKRLELFEFIDFLDKIRKNFNQINFAETSYKLDYIFTYYQLYFENEKSEYTTNKK